MRKSKTKRRPNPESAEANTDSSSSGWKVLLRWLYVLLALISIPRNIDWVLTRLAGQPQGLLPQRSAPTQMLLLIVGGGACAGLHAILWAVANKIFKWDFWAGGGRNLPYGFSAIVYGTTISVPPMLIAVISHRIFSVPRLPDRFFFSCVVTVIASLVAYLAVYGVSRRRFVGIRKTLIPCEPPEVLQVLSPRRLLVREVIVLAAYLAAIVTMTVAPFQIASGQTPLGLLLLERVLATSALPFLVTSAFMVGFYPWSVVDPRGRDARGYLVGFLLLTLLFLGLFY